MNKMNIFEDVNGFGRNIIYSDTTTSDGTGMKTPPIDLPKVDDDIINPIKPKVSPSYGIDLGTTNSCISTIISGSTPEIIPLYGGASTLPSCIMWKGVGKEFIVGREAYDNRYKESAIYSVKRLMGSGEIVTLRYSGKELKLTPSEVSAEILKELVKQASVFHKNIKDVVITVPAYFDNKQIEDTVEAGKLAGLTVLNILREPTSASLVYNLDKTDKDEELILVYDLGGGTFDVSLVKVTKICEDEDSESFNSLYDFSDNSVVSDKSGSSILTVLKNEGDMHLGGDDIDFELYKIIEDKIRAEGYDVNYIPREVKERLLLQVEQLKKMGEGIYKIPINFKLNNVAGDRVKADIMINEKDFKDSIRIIYKKTKAKLDLVLADSSDLLSSIVLVGGSTKSNLIKEFLKRDFPGLKLNDTLNPDEAVALGAGIQAKRIKHNDDNLEVFDIIPLSIGVLADGFVTRVINKNQTVPFSYPKLFTTTIDNQEEINIEVYQGNSPLKEECLYLGNLIVKDIPKGPAYKVAISITLSIDSNGLLQCSSDINGKHNSVELVNLFASSSKSNKVENRKLLRWRGFANTLELAEGKALNTLLDGYSKLEIPEETILEFIKSHRADPRFTKHKETIGSMYV